MGQIKPLGDMAWIVADPIKEKTDTGIFIPDQAREKGHTGTVFAVGKGKPGQKMEVKVGDRVLFNRHAVTEINYDDKPYLIIQEPNIFCVLEEKEEK
jgi:chaperonin GroES